MLTLTIYILDYIITKKKLLDQLINNTTDINAKYEDGKTMLHTVAQNNDLELVKKLLEMGADPSIVDNFGNRAATLTNKVDLRELLIEHELKTLPCLTLFLD